MYSLSLFDILFYGFLILLFGIFIGFSVAYGCVYCYNDPVVEPDIERQRRVVKRRVGRRWCEQCQDYHYREHTSTTMRQLPANYTTNYTRKPSQKEQWKDTWAKQQNEDSGTIALPPK